MIPLRPQSVQLTDRRVMGNSVHRHISTSGRSLALHLIHMARIHQTLRGDARVVGGSPQSHLVNVEIAKLLETQENSNVDIRPMVVQNTVRYTIVHPSTRKENVMTKTLPITEARQNLPDLVERVRKLRARYIITRNGRPDAVLIGHDEFESWLETMEVLTDREEIKAIQEGLADLRAGRVSSYEEVFGEPLSGQKPKGR